MEIFKYIKETGRILVLASAFGLVSCNYLDVVPPETADIDDTMKDATSTLNFLYSCYSPIEYDDINPLKYIAYDAAGDDYVLPRLWDNGCSRTQWGMLSPTNAKDWQAFNWGAVYPWKSLYTGIGQCNLFLKNLDELHPPITEDTYKEYRAEAMFLKAYYHMRALQLFGPIPIMDKLMPQGTPVSDMPGRSHFDFCVDYIVDLFDKAAADLPATRNTQYFGRATSVAAKALKARILVYAASPLWNSSETPLAKWTNTSYETPGYDKALVSGTYDAKKWERARQACQDALSSAESAGFRLFTVNDAETVREQHKVNLPAVPAVDGSSSNEQLLFLQRVMMFRYLITARPSEGNLENLWGTLYNGTNAIYAGIPHFVLKADNGSEAGGYGGMSPTLYAVEHFYTKNGKLPEEDPAFPQQSEWFKSANLTNKDIIKLHVGREARFYAWISFDGDEYSSYIVDGKKPLIVEARNPAKQGYDPNKWGERNNCVTGYLSKKGVQPNYYMRQIDGNNNRDQIKYPMPLIRMAELYLNLAECEAQVGGQYTESGIKHLNEIRRRAGVPELTMADLTAGKTLLDRVMEERFIEFFQEGQRYYDIRRYLNGAKYLDKDNFMGLNALVKSPSFEEFNQVTPINQPFKWDQRMYIMPIPISEIYNNPQLEQAPGY